MFFTPNGGGRWVKLTGDVPTISFRDLAIQRRENDLVGGSFGRGIFVLDDYPPLRDVTEEGARKEATLFPVRKAWRYVERDTLGQSAAPPGRRLLHGAEPAVRGGFTYHLAEDLKTKAKQRQEAEKPLSRAARTAVSGLGGGGGRTARACAGGRRGRGSYAGTRRGASRKNDKVDRWPGPPRPATQAVGVRTRAVMRTMIGRRCLGAAWRAR